MLLGMVDLLLVGRLGPAAQGAVGIGTSFFSWFLIFGIGLLSAMDYFVSTALGAGKHEDAAHSLFQGLWISTWLGLPLNGVLYAVARNIELFGIHPDVAPLASEYLTVLSFSLWPVYLFSAARNYLQALHRVWEGFALLVFANLLNYGLNLLWIPTWGSTGSAWATVVSRYSMAVVLLGIALFWVKKTSTQTHPFRSTRLVPNWTGQLSLLRLGIPAALQSTAEVGVFALSTLLAGRLNPESLAAHQIVLNLASMTFMVPLGIGTAAAVCVGFFLGRQEPHAARQQGWMALRYTLGFMSCTALIFATQGRPLLSIYTQDGMVLRLAEPVLYVAALFQLFDGTQTVLTGALRGWGITRAPLIVNLLGHWAIGLPVGLWLAFHKSMGILGIWIGLALGLTAVAILLLREWHRTSRAAAD